LPSKLTQLKKEKFELEAQIWWELLADEKRKEFIKKIFCEQTGQRDPYVE